MRHRLGFTLIELSIVLVIVALLISGIVLGRDVIEQAALRRLYSEVEQYKAALHTFRGKFNAYPGDMEKATDFWGERADCTTWPNLSEGNLTCNGDGDSMYYEDGGTGASDAIREQYLMWQHLANAGIVPGSYPGGNLAGSSDLTGVIIPRTKYNGAGISVNNDPASAWLNGNFFIVGTGFNSGANELSDVQGIISPVMLRAFDLKYDNGEAFTGRIRKVGRQGFAGGTGPNRCTTGLNSGQYKSDNVDNNARVCGIAFKLDF